MRQILSLCLEHVQVKHFQSLETNMVWRNSFYINPAFVYFKMPIVNRNKLTKLRKCNSQGKLLGEYIFGQHILIEAKNYQRTKTFYVCKVGMRMMTSTVTSCHCLSHGAQRD